MSKCVTAFDEGEYGKCRILRQRGIDHLVKADLLLYILVLYSKELYNHLNYSELKVLESREGKRVTKSDSSVAEMQASYRCH